MDSEINPSDVTLGQMVTAKMSLEAVEKVYVLKMYETCGFNAMKAARRLDIGRTSLYRKLKRWGVPTSTERPEETCDTSSTP